MEGSVWQGVFSLFFFLFFFPQLFNDSQWLCAHFILPSWEINPRVHAKSSGQLMALIKDVSVNHFTFNGQSVKREDGRIQGHVGTRAKLDRALYILWVNQFVCQQDFQVIFTIIDIQENWIYNDRKTLRFYPYCPAKVCQNEIHHISVAECVGF